MSEKKVYFDKFWQWQVEDVGHSTFAGGKAVFIHLKVLGGTYSYQVTEDILNSDRFEEVEG